MPSSSRRVWGLVGLFATFAMTGIPAESKAQEPPAGARGDTYGDPLPSGAVLRLGTVRYRQDSPIYRIAYTPDGRHFLTDGQDSVLRVWDAATGRIVRRIEPDVGVMADFAVTARGHLVMAMGTTLEQGRGFVYRVTITEIGTGQPVDVGSWTVDDARGFTVALCPDRQLVAAGMKKDGVRLLDAWTGAETGRFATGDLEAERIAFSRDGHLLAVKTWSRTDNDPRRELRVFDVDRKNELLVERVDQSPQGDPAFSPDDGTVAITRMPNLELLRVDKDKKDRITFPNVFVDHVGFTPDGRGLVGVAGFGLIGVFDLEKRQPSSSFRTGVSLDDTIALAPDGRTLLASSNGLVLHAWELETRRDRFASPDAHQGPITQVLISPDGKMAITGARDDTMRLWDLATGRPMRALRLSGNPEAVAISPGGGWVAAATTTFRQLFVWDLKRRGEGGPIVLTTRRGDDLISPLSLHFLDENKLLVIDEAGALQEVNLEERRVRPGLKIDLPTPDDALQGLEDHRLNHAVFLPGGKRVAMSHLFTGISVADLDTGKRVFDAEAGDLVAPSPDGRLLAVAGDSTDDQRYAIRGGGRGNHRTGLSPKPAGGTIRLLDATSGQEQQAMKVEGSKVWALAFSPDGKTLAATSGWELGQIHLFDVATGKETRTIDGPAFRSPALAFTPDGSRLITGMADGSVLVWDLRSNPGR